jgi:hypothetical protein
MCKIFYPALKSNEKHRLFAELYENGEVIKKIKNIEKKNPLAA